MTRTRLSVAVAFGLTFVAQSAFAFDHSKFDGLLKKYVSGGKVDYEGIRGEKATLDEYLKAVSSASGTQKLGFYINAYNALVINALLTETTLPAKVTDVKGFFDAKKYTVGGKSQTLNDLEGFVRSEFKDPRIHFALNCGAKSCPPIPGKVFPEDDASLDKILTDLTTKALNGSSVKIDDTKKEIQVIKLLDWYKDDFITKEGSVEKYLQKWVTDEKDDKGKARVAAVKAGTAGGYKITFQFYNWEVNKK